VETRLLVLALIPVTLAGAAIWLHEGGAAVRVARGVAVTAAVLVGLLVLLPEALNEGGPAVLAVLLLGVVVPSGIERLVHSSRMEAGVGLVAAGMVLHQVLDGVQMGAVGPSVGAPGVLALGLHGLPLAAVALMAMARSGRAPALALWVLLVVATGVGFAVGASVPPVWLAPWEPWIQAAVAGVLLHVLIHDISAARQEQAPA